MCWKKMKTLTTVPTGGEPAILGRRNIADNVKYAKVIKDFGISTE